MKVIIIAAIVTLIVMSIIVVCKAASIDSDKDYINWEKYKANDDEFKD